MHNVVVCCELFTMKGKLSNIIVFESQKFNEYTTVLHNYFKQNRVTYLLYLLHCRVFWKTLFSRMNYWHLHHVLLDLCALCQMRLHTGLNNLAIIALLHGEPQQLDCLPTDHHPEKKVINYSRANCSYKTFTEEPSNFIY